MGLDGEWWIDDSGQVLFADGDVGDMNHEMYVIDGLTRTILDAIGGIKYDEEYAGPMDTHDEAVREALGVDKDAVWGDLRQALNEKMKETWPDEAQREAALDAAYNMSDAREYAIQYNGWKRLKGTNVETWTLTKDDLDDIVAGIQDAADDEIPPKKKFFIEVRSNGKCFSDVPWIVLEDTTPTKLREYEMR
jgi:hypothetical protein